MRPDPEAIALFPWHLPGLGPPPDAWHEGRTPTGQGFRTPRLGASRAAGVADAVRSAALRARRERSLAEVVGALARAAGRLVPGGTAGGAPGASGPGGDAAGDDGAAALLSAELGWSVGTAAETLEGMGRGWTEEALRSLLRAELGDPALLEGYRPAPLPEGPEGPEGPEAARGRDRRRRAAGPPLLLQVHAGNLPGVAVTAAIRGLLVRSGVLCKAPREEPGLLALFAAALEAEDALLGASLATTWWPGAEAAEAWDAWGKRAGKAVVYGGADAVAGVRRRLPADLELLAYGPRVGIGVVLADAARGSEAGRAARALAGDAWAYEHQGCVSPRLVYVVGDASAFASRLAEALRERAARAPRSRPTPEEAVAVRSLRSRAEFRALAGDAAGAPPTVLFDRDDLSWTVVVDPSPGIATEALPGVVRVGPVADLEAVLDLLGPLDGLIQSVGYAGEHGLEALAEGAARLGAARVSPFGTVAWPPPDWRHDGRPQLLPLLRWTDWERTAPPHPAPGSAGEESGEGGTGGRRRGGSGAGVWERYAAFLAAPPETVLEWSDPGSDARGWLVINSLRGGAAGGGTRMRAGLGRDEVVFLAKIMELKFSIAGPPIGGAKSGLDFDPDHPGKAGVLRRWFAAIRPLLETRYATAGDLNVDEVREVVPLCGEAGIPHPQQAVARGHHGLEGPALERRMVAVREGLGRRVGEGLGISGVDFRTVDLVTGLGVAVAARRLLERQGGTLAGRRVLLEGFGSVGGAAALFLARWGARLVGIADARGALLPAEGLGEGETEDLLRRRRENLLPAGTLTVAGDEARRAFLGTPADLLVCAAASGTLGAAALDRLEAAGVAAVVCGANRPFASAFPGDTALEREADARFAVVADFVANCGAAHAFAWQLARDEAGEPAAILDSVEATVTRAVDEAVDRAARADRGLLAAALGAALERTSAG